MRAYTNATVAELAEGFGDSERLDLPLESFMVYGCEFFDDFQAQF
jgi:hypothetical protein